MAHPAERILSCITEAYFSLDNQWRFTYLNPRAETQLRRTRADLLGKVFWDEYPHLSETPLYGHFIRARQELIPVSFRQYSERMLVWLEIQAFPEDSGLHVYFRDVTEQHRNERHLERVNRALKALSGSNQVLLRSTDEDTITAGVCRVATEAAGYRMAWVGYLEHDEKRTVRPVAWCGQGLDYLNELRITWADEPHGRGPVGTAVRTGRTVCFRDVRREPDFEPWREKALRYGFASLVALPLKTEDSVFGVLALYAADPAEFEGEEQALLEELAADLAFGIGAIRLREREQTVRKALAESEARYRSLFQDNYSVMVLIDPESETIVDANPAACHFYGYPREQLAGSRLDSIATQSTANIRSTIAFIQDGGGRFRTKHRLASGELRDVEVFSGPVPIESKPHLLSIVHDISEQTRAERDVKTSGERYRALSALLHSYGFSYSIDEAGQWRPEWVTDTVEQVTGYSQREIERFGWPAAIHPEDEEAFGAFRQAALTNRQMTLDYRIITPAGEIRWIRTLYLPEWDEASGRVIRVHGAGQDITAQKAFEQELIRAREKAEEMDRMKSAFLANMSHEIRTPLTTVIGFADILHEETGGSAREFAYMIRQGARRLLDTLNAVLDLAQLQSGSREWNRQMLDPVAALEHLMQLFEPAAADNDVRLSLEAETAPESIVTDPAAFDRIVSNLLSNAVKFTRNGSVTGRLAHTADELHLEVEDTGIGIDPAYLPHLFDEFSQESSGSDRSHEGAGLGLAITKRLVDGLGGSIEVRSRQGAGSVFSVVLPVG